MPVPNDLRDYIEAIAGFGQLRRVRAEVNWDLEIGTLHYEVIKSSHCAVLFENVKGCPGGFAFSPIRGTASSA